jgi:hypothetical protein
VLGFAVLFASLSKLCKILICQVTYQALVDLLLMIAPCWYSRCLVVPPCSYRCYALKKLRNLTETPTQKRREKKKKMHNVKSFSQTQLPFA